jgi:hypothetical protein
VRSELPESQHRRAMPRQGSDATSLEATQP